MLSNYISSEILSKMFFGSSVEQYITAIIYFLIGIIALGILQKVIISRLKKLSEKTKNDIDDVAIEIVESIRPKFYIILSFYIALQVLSLGDVIAKITGAIFMLIVIFQVTTSLQLIVKFIANKVSDNGDEESEKHTKSAMHLLGTILTVFIWVIGTLLILSNIGVNVSSLIAGLGIGGIAIAFALKEVLADLLSSFSIYFDKPFKAGDTISLGGGDSGKVEKIGIKTTRVRTTSGEQMVVSNQDLTSTRVRNFRQMERRRVSFLIKVVMSTPLNKLKSINYLVKEIVDSVDNITFSRCHFSSIDDWSHTFKVVYHVDSRSFDDHVNAKQEVNFKLLEKLEEAKIEMAYPTQTQYVIKNNESVE